MKRSDGTGGTILSSLRFNIITELITDYELHLRAISRTTKLKGVREVSFILTLVNINNYPADQIVHIRKMAEFNGWQWFKETNCRYR